MNGETVTEAIKKDSILSWARFWATPLGVFVVLISLAFAAQVYNSLQFQQEIQTRRMQFCQRQNEDARKTRALWEGVIAVSSEEQGEPVVIILDGRRLPAELIDPQDPERIARFRKVINDVYPVVDCEKF